VIHFVPPDLRRLSDLRVDALVLPVWSDERPLRGTLSLVDWRLAGQLSRLVQAGHLSGAVDETVLVATGGKFPFSRVFALGAGPRGDFDDSALTHWYGRAFETLGKAEVHASAWGLPGASDAAKAERAMEVFEKHRRRDRSQDEITVIEDGDFARVMQGVIERERRRAQAEPNE